MISADWTVWTHLTALAAALVLVRLVCFINQMLHTRVPQSVILSTIAFGAGALGVCLSPFFGQEYAWNEALLLWGAAAYVWRDRRRPVHMPPGRLA
jgi:predicted membrane channel-forming protein YqfA (hemolysin III family)